MSAEHKVIFIPGLEDKARPLERAVRHWQKHDLMPIVHPIGWNDRKTPFEPKLKQLVEMVDRFTQEGDKVSLVGISAGGSAVVNAFIERKKKVNRVINVCGRLERGSATGFRSFESRTASSPSFAESVNLCESRKEELLATDKQKIMTVRAMFGDELVPADTTIMVGAYNIAIPTLEHNLSILAALTVFSKPLILFLKQA